MDSILWSLNLPLLLRKFFHPRYTNFWLFLKKKSYFYSNYNKLPGDFYCSQEILFKNIVFEKRISILIRSITKLKYLIRIRMHGTKTLIHTRSFPWQFSIYKFPKIRALTPIRIGNYYSAGSGSETHRYGGGGG